MRAFPLDQGPRDRRLVELRGEEKHQALQAEAAGRGRRHVADGAGRTSIACRSSASASSASCARTSATCCATTRCSTQFAGPRHLVYAAALEMHPLDAENRARDLKAQHGIGYCNITKCCTKVCPESITITDNAIIPLEGTRHRSALRSGRQVVQCCCVTRGRHIPEVAMKFELKTLSPEAVARALAKAERYRLLNEPGEAREHLSRCPGGRAGQPGGARHAAARAHRSVRSRTRSSVAEAWSIVARLRDDYARAYLLGHRLRAAGQGASVSTARRVRSAGL